MAERDLKLKGLENSVLVSIYDSWVEEVAFDGEFANWSWTSDKFETEEANEIEGICNEDYNVYNIEKLMKILEERYPDKTIVIVKNGIFNIGGKK